MSKYRIELDVILQQVPHDSTSLPSIKISDFP